MSIVVLGGGSAGWLTALYAKKIFNDKDIVLVESEDYGILGAGEGSTPKLIDFLNFLEIPFQDLIKECKSTIKNGVKFTNWSKDKGSYLHPFFSESNASNDYNFHLDSHYKESDSSFAHYCASLKNHNLKDYSLMEKVSDKNLVPFIDNNENKSIDQLAQISIHFDAKLLAGYLRTVGEKRGIIRKEGIVNKIFNDKDGYINKIKTEKEEIDCEFIFDCSGFKKLIIGNHYKSKWKSHSEQLPVKKAIPFFLEIDKEIPPYTEAIAMDYGWMWKIPLQHRYGCGYVFDSNYISDEDAIKEIENYLGFEPKYPRELKNAFNFSAGCYEEIWIKNSLAVGLSSGFVEPLEATSIMQAILVLQRFMSDKTNLNTKNNFIKQRFNELYLNETQEVVDFLYLHYITNKNNTDFWKNFSKNNKMPKNVNYILNVFKDKSLYNNFDFYSNSFINGFSYLYVLIGQKILNKVHMKKNAKFLLDDVKKQDYEYILNNQKKLIPKFLTHNDFIDIIKNDKNV
jgi:tryptophan halogenase